MVYYREQFSKRQRQLDILFWDDAKGAWFDYHINEGRRDTRFFASMIAPMFTNCHGDRSDRQEYKVEKMLRYIQVHIFVRRAVSGYQFMMSLLLLDEYNFG